MRQLFRYVVLAAKAFKNPYILLNLHPHCRLAVDLKFKFYSSNTSTILCIYSNLTNYRIVWN